MNKSIDRRLGALQARYSRKKPVNIKCGGSVVAKLSGKIATLTKSGERMWDRSQFGGGAVRWCIESIATLLGYGIEIRNSLGYYVAKVYPDFSGQTNPLDAFDEKGNPR